MANEYRSNYRPNDYIQEGQFNPIEIGSPVNAMREEQARQRENDKEVLAQIKLNQKQEIRNLEVEYENNQQDNKDLENLSKLSQSLTEKLIKIQGDKNEADLQRGLQKAYIDGISAQDATAFNQEESELITFDTAGRKAATAAQQRGLGASTANQIRNLSGWEAYGYAQGMAIQGGLAYSDFFNEAKRTATVEITDENGLTRQVTYGSAETVSEREAVATVIRNKYLQRFTGMRPALLNKYLYPNMKRAEAAQAIQWDKDKELLLTQKRKDQAVTFLTQSLQAGQGGAGVMRILDQFEGDFGTPREAREFVKETLNSLVKSHVINLDDVKSVLTHQFINHNGKLVSIEDQWPLEFRELRSIAIQAEKQRLDTEDQVMENNSETFRQMVQKAQQERRKNGEPEFSAEDKKKFLEHHEQEIGGPTPDWLNNLVTREEESDEAIEDRATLLLNSRGYLLDSDLDGASNELYRSYKKQNLIRTVSPLVEFKKFFERGEEMVDSYVRSVAGLTGDARIADQPIARQAQHRAKDEFQLELIKNLRTMEPQKAYDEALKYVEGRLTLPKDKTELSDLPIMGEMPRDREKARRELAVLDKVQDDPDIINTQIIPGTQQDLEQLIKYAETGRGNIPDIYRRIAHNSNGTLSAWDVAQAQLSASGKGTMLRLPAAEQAVKELEPDVQKLLQWRPTNSRTTRAMLGGNNVAQSTGDNWKTFLDLVASVESKSYGDYDAYNMGGSGGGHVAHGSGDSSKDGRFGKPLSQLTVNEVVSLGNNREIFAAGRYQFIPSTLKETIKEAGLTGDELFDASTQDRLAIARARWRMKNDGGMAGLRREWIGLTNVRDEVLRPAMQGIVNDRSPYNQPQNLSIGVRKAVYTTGNIGPTSTGEHLDVKSTDGSYFNYSDLNNYVDVQDRDLGLVPLGKVPQTGDWYSHTRRGSHGRDYGTYSGSKLYLKNGAKVVSSTPTVHGDYTVISLPDGREFSFLHGKKI